MTELCPDISVLPDLMALERGDPRRAHVDDCPRCQARWLDLGLFLQPPPLPAGADPDDARARMLGTLDREFERGRAPAPSETPRPRRFAGLLQPRVAWGLAGLVGLVGLAYFTLVDRTPGPDLLREGPPSTQRSSTVSTLEAPERAGDDLILRWSRVPEADAYEVCLVGEDLTEILVVGPLPDTSVVLKAGQAPGVERGAILGWQVVARRAGDEIGRSRPGTLTLP